MHWGVCVAFVWEGDYILIELLYYNILFIPIFYGIVLILVSLTKYFYYLNFIFYENDRNYSK